MQTRQKDKYIDDSAMVYANYTFSGAEAQTCANIYGFVQWAGGPPRSTGPPSD